MRARHLPWSHVAPIAALVAFAAVAGAFHIKSTDVFWHLAAGRWILENQRIPSIDPFRFTSEGTAWVDHEWLFQVLIHGVERMGGIPGLVLTRSALALVLAGVLFAALRRMGTPLPETVLVTFLAILGARPRFLIRPEILTLIALSLLLLLLRRFRSGHLRGGITMTLLTVVWVNLHAEALLAPMVAGAYLLGAAVQDRLGSASGPGDYLPWRGVVAMPAVLSAALFLNPYGWRVLHVPFGITGAMRDLAAYNPEWVSLRVAPQPFLFTGFVAVATLVAYGAWRTRQVHLPTLLVALFLAVIALSAVRHQAVFFIGATFLAGETVSGLARHGGTWSGGTPRRVAALATIACVLGLAWCAFPPSRGPLRPRQGAFPLALSIDSDRFPARAADYLEAHPEIGPLFNSFAHGGYLLWRLYPPRQVFHDGRMELQPDLLREIGRARSSNREWDALLERYGAVGALVRYDERLRPVLSPDPATGGLELVEHRTSNALLFPPEVYALVYWDDVVMLFLRRSLEENGPFLEEEYRFIQPEDLRWTLGRAAEDPTFLDGCLQEVERKLQQDPDCERARRLKHALEEVSSLESGVESQESVSQAQRPS